MGAVVSKLVSKMSNSDVLQEWSKLEKGTRGPSEPTHHPKPCLPYKAPGDLFEGKQEDNLPLNLCHTHPASHQPFPLLPDSSAAPNTINLWMLLHLLKPPKDSLEMPEPHTVTVGNRAWICHLPVGGHRGCSAEEVLGGR